MRFLDLFAGIGGFSLGLERAGMICAGQVEIDEFCSGVLSKHWPQVKRMRDIREVAGDEFGAIELICGGFPCQPFSRAGKRRGKKDDRYLWPEMVRVIGTMRPRWILGENVVGIVDMELDAVLSDLAYLGYACQALIIPACSLDAEHRRDRIFIIANINKNELCRFVFPKYSEDAAGFFEEDLKKGHRGFSELGSILSMPRDHSYARNRRKFYGIPAGMDRLGALGNAVAPPIAEVIGRAVMQTESAFDTMEAVNTGIQQPYAGREIPAPNACGTSA